MKLKDICNAATSPKAFSTYAVIGVGVTVVLAILNTRKQCQIEAEREEKEEMTREDVVEELKQTAKTYAPTLISTAATIYCINKAETKWIDYNGLINASYVASQDKLNRFRAAVPSLAAAEIVHGFGHQQAEQGKHWFCVCAAADEEPVYFESTEADVIYAEYCLNRNFQFRGSASVREFFAFLDIQQHCSVKDEMLGWDIGIMLEDWGLEFPWIDFYHDTAVDQTSGQEITMIQYTWEPEFSADDRPLSNPWEYMPSSYNVPRE